MSQSAVLKTKDAAERLQVSRRTLERWRRVGCGPQFVRFGRAIRYRLEDLEAWVISQQESQS